MIRWMERELKLDDMAVVLVTHDRWGGKCACVCAYVCV